MDGQSIYRVFVNDTPNLQSLFFSGDNVYFEFGNGVVQGQKLIKYKVGSLVETQALAFSPPPLEPKAGAFSEPANQCLPLQLQPLHVEPKPRRKSLMDRFFHPQVDIQDLEKPIEKVVDFLEEEAIETLNNFVKAL